MSNKEGKTSWFSRLRSGLSQSSSKLSGGITDIFTKSKLDEDSLEELEDLLIMGDLGPATARHLVEEISKNRFGKEVSPHEIRTALSEEITKILEPVAKPLPLSKKHKPYILLFIGVNGSGKTTTMGKLAYQFRRAGKSVLMVAGDTFRAAAVGQLQIWGERANAPIIAGEQGCDAAGLAFGAVEKAMNDGTDIVMIDTAGRLQNKKNLMEELAKISRVLKKQDIHAPHATLLVLDATTGQNAFNQVEIFSDICDVTGLIVTKLDGSAKGGVLVGLAEKFNLPVHAVGVGEGLNDLRPFKAKEFSESLIRLTEVSDSAETV